MIKALVAHFKRTPDERRHRKNLAKLAIGLLNMPPPDVAFNMGVYAGPSSIDNQGRVVLEKT